MIRFIIYFFIGFYCYSVNSESNSDYSINDQYSQYTHGGIGLIQTPTANFSNDGEFGFGISNSVQMSWLLDLHLRSHRAQSIALRADPAEINLFKLYQAIY